MTSPDKRAGSASELSALRERVGKATGPDRELDLALMCTLYQTDYGEHFEKHLAEVKAAVEKNGLTAHRPEAQLRDHVNTSPRFTASIDAAVALVERVLPGWHWCADNGDGEFSVTPRAVLFAPGQNRSDGKEYLVVNGKAATPALAILSALLASLEPGT